MLSVESAQNPNLMNVSSVLLLLCQKAEVLEIYCILLNNISDITMKKKDTMEAATYFLVNKWCLNMEFIASKL